MKKFNLRRTLVNSLWLFFLLLTPIMYLYNKDIITTLWNVWFKSIDQLSKFDWDSLKIDKGTIYKDNFFKSKYGEDIEKYNLVVPRQIIVSNDISVSHWNWRGTTMGIK